MKIVAFGYKSRSGKDTAAKMLVQKARLCGRFNNVQHVPFARKLKQIAKDLFGIYGLQDGAFYEKKENEHLRDVRLSGIDRTPVQLWIALGNGLRELTHEFLWIDHVLSTKCDLLVISDMRYPNEFKMVRERGGLTIKMLRDSAVEKGSDKYLDVVPDKMWDRIIDNNFGLPALDTAMDSIIESLTGDAK